MSRTPACLARDFLFMKTILHAFAVMAFACISAFFVNVFWLPFLAVIPALIVTRVLKHDFSLWRFAILGAFVPVLLNSNGGPLKSVPIALPAVLFSALATNGHWNELLWLELYLAAYLLFTWLIRRLISGRIAANL